MSNSNIIRQLRNAARKLNWFSRTATPSENDNEAYPDDLAGLASVLSVPVTPSPLFVDSLGQTLATLQVDIPTAREPVRPSKFQWRKVGFRIGYAAIALAFMGALVVFLNTDRRTLELADSFVLSDAADQLNDVRTVRYEVRTEQNHGLCYTHFGETLTPDEIATVVARGETSDGTGTVFGCANARLVIFEKGVLDLENRALHGVMTSYNSNGIQLSIDPNYSSSLTEERLYLDEYLWSRGSEDANWFAFAVARKWTPFSFGELMKVPAGDLDFLQVQYDKIEIVGNEMFEGERVTHYQANNAEADADIQAVKVWIGIDDGLLRKAVVTTETPRPEIDRYNEIKNTELTATWVEAEQRNDPIVRRGEWPETRILTYRYIFKDFNKAVEIPTP